MYLVMHCRAQKWGMVGGWLEILHIIQVVSNDIFQVSVKGSNSYRNNQGFI